MDPLTMGLISGGSSLLGSIFSSATSAQNTQAQIAAQEQMQGQTEQFNAQQAEMNRQFQQQMSSTAYQRSTADMKAAGLNPMMMFGSGGPASVPGGASASVGTPSVPMPSKTSPFAGLGAAVTQGVQSMVDQKKIDMMTSEIAKLGSEKDLLDKGLIPKTVAQAWREGVGFEADKARLPTSVWEGVKAGDLLSLDPDWRRNAIKGGFYGDKLSEMSNPLTSLVSSAGGAKRMFSSPPEPIDKRPAGYTESVSRHGDTTFRERSFDYFDRQ